MGHYFLDTQYNLSSWMAVVDSNFVQHFMVYTSFAGVLTPTLGFYKNRVLGWAKNKRVCKTPNKFRASCDSTFAYP